MPPDPLAIACWLCFAQHGSQALDWKLVTKISRAAYVGEDTCDKIPCTHNCVSASTKRQCFMSTNKLYIDTGAEISIIPPSHSDRKYRQEGCNLLAVNESTIATYGKRSLTLDLGLRRTFR